MHRGRLEIRWRNYNAPETPPRYGLVFNCFADPGGAHPEVVLPGTATLLEHIASLGIKDTEKILESLKERYRWLSEELALDDMQFEPFGTDRSRN